MNWRKLAEIGIKIASLFLVSKVEKDGKAK